MTSQYQTINDQASLVYDAAHDVLNKTAVLTEKNMDAVRVAITRNKKALAVLEFLLNNYEANNPEAIINAK